MKKNKNPITVYWCPDALTNRESSSVLLDLKPKSVQSEIQKKRAKNPLIPKSLFRPNLFAFPGQYQTCTALHELTENLYMIKSPFDASVNLNKDGSINPESGLRWELFHERISSVENSLSLDLLLSFVMFSEEKLEVSWTPPYLHNTEHSKYGFLSSIKVDISSWFRPFIFIFQLWENINHIEIKVGEPLAYIKFETDRPIIFKQFKLNEELAFHLQGCLNHKTIIPNEKMSKLYDRFNRTGMRNRVLKEIKANIID